MPQLHPPDPRHLRRGEPAAAEKGGGRPGGRRGGRGCALSDGLLKEVCGFLRVVLVLYE